METLNMPTVEAEDLIRGIRVIGSGKKKRVNIINSSRERKGDKQEPRPG